MIRPIQCFRFLAAGLLFMSCLAGSAAADPTGTTYQLTLQNLSIDATDDNVVFDMDATLVGDMLVSEMATTLPNGNDLIELWFKKEDGTPPITTDLQSPFGILISGLHWINDSGDLVPGAVVENSAFIVFTIDDVPLEFPGSTIPHPTDPTIPVVPVQNPGTELSDFTDVLVNSTGLTLPEIVGQELAEQITDFHIGIEVRHVPEPGALTLAGLCGMVLLAGLRRRTR